ncbi:LysR family transcriptional regulator [Algirhabdus cladophorae]|uniref:LysR family transcriptional regulator n=1 Tax=Algirhabdus cladophorae TaxID=3377108 RepID=UPI003B8499B8
MIEDYRGLGIFVAVADAGSLSAAGRRLKLSTSVVSHHLSRLEAKLGVTLFFRSTRALTLTSEGQAMLGPARRMVEAASEALDSLSDTAHQPVGALRLTLPAFGDRSPVHQAVWAFARAHPMVALSIHTTDLPVDLVKEGYDLAIRLGALSDGPFKSKRIGSFQRTLVASPSYLATRPAIKGIADLQSCDFVSLSMVPDTIALLKQGREVLFEPENIRLEVNSVAAAKAAALADLGVMRLPRSEIGTEVATGQLTEVLPSWSLPTLGVYAVWPDIGPQKKLTRRLIDFLDKL